MKVLFLNPPFVPNFLRTARCTFLPISGSSWYPIFLAYAAGWVEKHGHTIKLIDAPVAQLSHEDVYDQSSEFVPDLLVLYISKESLKNDILVGKEIKKRTRCKIVLVGPWCARDPKKLLTDHPVIDYVVRREFDDAVRELASGNKPASIKGIAYRTGNTVRLTDERPFITPKQLDSFPFVSKIYKEHVPIKKYFQASLLHPYIDVFTARGCAWNQCTFCLWPNTIHKGASYRARSLENVIEEFRYIQKELPFVKEVFIQDDMLPAGRARQLSEMILDAHLDMHWSCYVKADVDLKTLKLMKRAGCRYVHVGYETVDPIIIRNIKKGTNRKTMTEFTKNTKIAGLRVHGDFILGLPGETEETIKKTITWAKSLDIEGYQIFIPQPHEDTPMYEYLKSKGYLTRNGDINYPHLSKEQLSEWRFWALRYMYLNPTYMLNTLKNVNSPSELFRLMRTGFHVIPHILMNR